MKFFKKASIVAGFIVCSGQICAKNLMPYPTTPLNENYNRTGLEPDKSLNVGLQTDADEEPFPDIAPESSGNEEPSGIDVIRENSQDFQSESFMTPEEFDQSVSGI